jgi:hypothetical protein
MSSRTSAAAFMSASTLRSMSSSQEGASPSSREAPKTRVDRRRATRDARRGRVLVEDAPLAWQAARCDGVGDAVDGVAMRAFWSDSESA